MKLGEWNTLADIKGAGMINHMWLTFPNGDTLFGRRNLLRIYWDGEEEPSVEIPLSDFFGVLFGFTGSELYINSKYIIVTKKMVSSVILKCLLSKAQKLKYFLKCWIIIGQKLSCG